MGAVEAPSHCRSAVLPVFTAAEMRELDERAISRLGIPGADLMENAGRGAATLIAGHLGPLRGKPVAIVCGKGNNGGDGLVVARHLRTRGARASVWLLGRKGEVKGDAGQALRRWRGRVEEVVDESGLARLRREMARAALVVDGLLGTGLSGPARGLVAATIEAVNQAERPVVALDLPSGLDADRGEIIGPAIRADITATFAGYKRALLLHPAAGLAGRVSMIPIGIPQAELDRGVDTFLLEAGDVRRHFPARVATSHKGSYGHLLVIGGSLGKTGAAALAGRAALRSGAGLVTIATPSSQQPIVAALGMEPMTEALPETAAATLALKAGERIHELASRTDAVALGPGISLDPETQELVRALVVELPRPMVLDADALSALAGHLDLLRRGPAPRLLTPHPGEMGRMLGTSVAEVQRDRLGTVRSFCRQHQAWLVLKGAGSAIGDPDGRLFINPTGNPGMATGGAGDVLTGMAGAFLARGLSPLDALQSATFVHGLAGDLACAERGAEGLIAGDILEAIPAAMRLPAS
jgi:hydroxyethylthiazole kinase-like uncharacterized protein yjeF